MSWDEDDQRAALEWQAREDSLCGGCGEPRDESFALEMDDRYEVEVMVCHACAARQRKSNAMHSQDAEIVGDYYIVTPEVADG